MDYKTVLDYLEERGERYGISLKDLLSMTPQHLLDDPVELLSFWEHKDLRHIFPVNSHPGLTEHPSTLIPEDSDSNPAGRNAVISNEEGMNILLDNSDDAFDLEFDNDGISDIIL